MSEKEIAKPIGPTDAEQIVALQKELDKTRTEVAQAKRDLLLARARETKKEKKEAEKEPASKTSTPPLLGDPHADHAHEGTEAETGHLMHRWQRFCTGPNCEGENPDFKDETICNPDEGGCGMHLGSVDVAKSLSRCPSCGGRKVKRINK